MTTPAERLAAFFEGIELAHLGQLHDLYAPDARFKDPFNEVRGAAAIERIFRHMYEQVEAPRFAVTGRFERGCEAILLWRMDFGFRRGGARQTISGASHLRFDAQGRVQDHRDYWDPAEELYAKLPLLGALMRFLARRLRA